MKLRRLLTTTTTLVVATIFSACGEAGDETQDSAAPPETTFGSAADVSGYLSAVGPFIQRIGAIQAAVDEVLGSSGRGTGKNLAPAATIARDQLNSVLEKVSAVSPPPLLAPFHRDMKKLIALRLEAYDATITGWKLEQDGSDFRGHYDDAQDKYQVANEIIVSLNGQMEKIVKALQAAPG